MALFGFGARINQALLDRSSQIGRRYTQEEFAAEVGMAERGKPYTGAAVTDWIKERRTPDLPTFRAMATVLQRPMAWLMAADEPSPADDLELPDPTKDRKLTLEEARRAVQQAERERSEQAARAKGVANGTRKPRRRR